MNQTQVNSNLKTTTTAFTCTTAGLIKIFSWLLWGDFFYILFETLIPRIFPLILQEQNAPNVLIGIAIGSVPAFFNIFVAPFISVKSDRFQSKLGRRIPFLLLSSPFAALFLILIGYSQNITNFLYTILGFSKYFDSNIFSLFIICVLIVIFQFFNNIMNIMFNYLIPDVVPKHLIGQFMTFFKSAATAAGFIFSRYLFPYGNSHRQELFLYIGLSYLVIIILVCLNVKESNYSTPSEIVKKSLFNNIQSYFKECFSVPLFVFFFFMHVFMMLPTCMMPFNVFFAKDTLKLSLEEIGSFFGWTYLVFALTTIPMGWLTNKIHPVRMNVISTFLIALGHLLVLFFVKDIYTLYFVGFPFIAASAAWGISSVTSGIIILPKAKYGQFMSASGLIIAIGLMFGNSLSGLFMDLMKSYRAVYLWNSITEFIAFFMAIGVYVLWKKHGGASNYIVPEPTTSCGTNNIRL